MKQPSRRSSPYPYSALGGLSAPAALLGATQELAARAVQRQSQVVQRLGADDEVEGRGQGGALVKVAHPQLGARELPLHVSVVLQAHAATTGPTHEISV